MSFHRNPKYQRPELIQALKDHGLEHDSPSQLADAFRTGWAAAIATPQPAAKQAEPVARDGWRSLEPYLGKDVANKEVVLLDDVKALLAASPTQPRPQPPYPERVTWTITEGYRLHKYAQGTKECIAFHRGIEFAEGFHGITAQEPKE